MGKKEQSLVVSGTVTESFAGTRFHVRLETGQQVMAYLAGNLRRFRIRIVPGDQVEVELSPYDLARGRIIYRQR